MTQTNSPAPPADAALALSAGGPAGKPPRLALLIATGFGLGYLPKAPGTWGSLGGIALCVGTSLALEWLDPLGLLAAGHPVSIIHIFVVIFTIVILAALTVSVGIWAADSVARFSHGKDPQHVVIDEVSGQMIALFGLGFALGNLHYEWKSLGASFILFRVFDIWKPWPVRQAEKMPGGDVIMADDLVAGAYAALCLWALRALGYDLSS